MPHNRILFTFSFKMKKFITHIFSLGIAIAVSVGFILSRAGGHADPFYLKFTGGKKSSLIIGTSKAAQGLQPNILKEVTGKDFYNYAFAIYSSPYGKSYFQSIQKKLTKSDSSQVFILSVDPWSLSSTTSDPNDTLNFRENNSYIAGIDDPCQSVNYTYLFQYFDEPYYKILTNNSTAVLQPNGWLAVTLPVDTASSARRRNFTITDYKTKLTSYQFSSVRYTYLLRTVDYLKNYGSVYLVRLPVHPSLMALENQLMPEFDTTLRTAISHSDGYLDLSPDNAIFQYTDGVHLTKADGEKVSELIGQWIRNGK